ncbi:MAG: sensor histidine kinase [Bacteroidota bacterium]
MRTHRKLRQPILIVTLAALTIVLVYYSRDFSPFAAAVARYALFIPVICAAHVYGVNGGIAVSMSLSTLLLPLVVGRALVAGAATYGLEITVDVVALNLIGYSWGALAGAQRRQRQLYQELHELAQRVSLDPRATALAVLDASLANVPAAGGIVALTIDPDFKLHILAARGLNEAEVGDLERSFTHGETIVEWAIMANRGAILNRLAQDPRFRAEAPGAPRNLLVAPLTRGEEISGGILLFDRLGWEGFVPSDLEWLTRLAERASVALENARLYTVSQAMAEENARYYKELKVYANELDRLVDERTRALTKAMSDLKEAEADLVRASRLAAVGELAGRVAHEILNPLTGILGKVQGRLAEAASISDQRPLGVMAAILATWRRQDALPGQLAAYLAAPSPTAAELSCGQEDLRDLERLIQLEEERYQRYQHDLAFIEAQTLRLARMVESLRELGRRIRSVRAVDLPSAVREAAEIMAAVLQRAGVELTLDLADNLPPVTADPDELVQVFANLLHNAAQAVEATGRAHGRVSVTARATRDRVELCFSDDGIGIPAQDLDKVFDAGYTTKPREEGTGLGLSISRRFVRECHGDVEIIRTEAGKGTSFLVWFPLARGEGATGTG